MPKNKNPDFNPLDILATAAALQSEDKKSSDETGMTQQTNKNGTKTADEQADPQTNQKPKVEVRKIKVITVCSDLDKMFDEHNYGNSRKINIKTSGSCIATDALSTNNEKERKVIVTVVDKSGDHRVVKTFNSVKVPSDHSSSGSAHSVDENPTRKTTESIKISCGEELVNNSTEGDNCCKTQVNKDSPDQIQLFTSITQVSGDKNNPQDISGRTTNGGTLINFTSTCQESDQAQDKSSHDKGSECDQLKTPDKDKIEQVSSIQQDRDMGQKLKVDIDQEIQNITTEKTESVAEDSVNDIFESVQKAPPDEQNVSKIHLDNKNLVSYREPEILSSKASIDVQLSPTEKLVANTANVSDDKSIWTSAGENTVYDSTLSDREQINKHSGREGERSTDMISDCRESGEKELKLDLCGSNTSEVCDHGHNNKDLLSPLGRYPDSLECSECFKNLDDTHAWHYEGETGRSDVRLSIDLESPKSEKLDNKNDMKSPEKEVTEHYNSVTTVYDSKDSTTEMCGTENRKCYFEDHCYADISCGSRVDRVSQSSTDDDSGMTSTDLSQDSGYGDVGQSPNTKEVHVDVCGLEESCNKNTLTIGGKTVLLADSSLLPLLQMKSSKGGLAGFSEINRARDAIVALVQSSDDTLQNAKINPQTSPVSSISPSKKDASPRFGKYRIGTFASVSNSAIGLESPKKPNMSQSKGGKSATSLLSNLPSMISQGKSRGGDRQTERKACPTSHVTGKRLWKTHIDHDHDYCILPEQEGKISKDSVSKQVNRNRDRKNGIVDKKSKKVMSDIDTTDFEDSTDSFSLELEDSSQPSSPNVLHSHGTRQKFKSNEKIAEYVKTGSSDSKLKITGSFQDDYIYFLNTKSRSRRRTVSQDMPVPIPGDRILLPLPKPGDIVVPHLTDADLEAIKQGHPSAAKPMQRYPVTSIPQTLPSVTKSDTTTSSVSQISTKSQSFSDEESKIINTILSMESGESSGSQASIDMEGTILSSATGDNLLSNINLTPEQMEIIYHAMDEVQSLSPDVSSVDNTFDVDNDMTTITDAASKSTHNIGSASSSAVAISVSRESTPASAEDSENPSFVALATKSVTKPSCDSTPTAKNELLVQDNTVTHSGISGPAVVPLGPGVVNTMPDISFHSLDKSSLDIFGNDLKLFPEASVETPAAALEGTTSSAEESNKAVSLDSTEVSTSINNSSITDNNSAPWIVTVSMYWNDVPAIMINKLPYVRLVDIHKQILPAKDTGILKKRCQLLGVPVLNCSEMQRYFLVQYGKAFNSKSTLIVGKDDAKTLIGYYVNPIPTPHRTKEPRPVEKFLETENQGLKPSRWTPLLKQKLETDISSKRNTSTSTLMHEEMRDIGQEIVTTDDPVLQVTGVSLPLSPPMIQLPTDKEPSKQLSRTRHKKINFLEMLKGDSNNNTSNEAGMPLESREHIIKIDRPVKSEKVRGRKSSPESKPSASDAISDGNIKSEKINRHRNSSDECVQVELASCDSESENNVTVSGKRKVKPDTTYESTTNAKKSAVERQKKASPLKVKWTLFNKKNTKKVPVKDMKTESKEILAVVHKDMTPRNGQRGRVQAGNVFIDMYDGPNVPCVRCCTCKKLFSVDNFLKHLHEVGGNGKLLMVMQPQTFALRDSFPSEYQKKLWGSFQKRRRQYNSEAKTQNNVQMEVKKNVEVDEGIVTKIQSSLMKDRNVRISARKRKPKQLHPIENYSFSKATASGQGECEYSDNGMLITDTDGGPTSTKLSRIMPNLSAGMQAIIKHDQGLTPSSSESVVTLTNGPEVISFTALENGFDV